MQMIEVLKKGKYVIGVSGGSDSMALLHMCVKNKIDVIVAHMNYHKRESANRDENLVCTFCQTFQIPCEIASSKGYEKGNFQANARKERYLFYQEVLKKYDCDGVLLAHHQDDVLETYLMQKQRGSICDYYGIQEEVCLFQMKIYRPLLNDSKQSLEEYCHMHKIEYGVDESNLSDDYTRNYIRHHIVEKLTIEERMHYLQQIQIDNELLMEKKSKIQAFFNQWNHSKKALLAQEYCEDYLQEWIYQECHIRLAKTHICGFIQQMQSSKQWYQALNQEYDLVCDYEELHIQRRKDISYAYKLEKGEWIQGKYFKMDISGPSTCAVTLQDEDYPITIRNVQEGDKIVLRFGTKKLSRFFIDRHIPLSQRRCWPVLVNNMGEIVMVPEIGCDVKHFSNTPNLFVLK